MFRIDRDFKYYQLTELDKIGRVITSMIKNTFEPEFAGTNVTSPYYVITLNEYDMFGYSHNTSLLSWKVCCNVFTALFKDAIDTDLIPHLEDQNINLLDDEIVVDLLYPGDRSVVILNTNYITPYYDEVSKFMQDVRVGNFPLSIKFNVHYKPFQHALLLPQNGTRSAFPYYGSIQNLENAILQLVISIFPELNKIRIQVNFVLGALNVVIICK